MKRVQCINIRFAACLPSGSRDCQRCEELLITARRPAQCSANLIAGVAADTTVNGVICAHMPADGAYLSDAEVASVRVASASRAAVDRTAAFWHRHICVCLW